jgi:ribosomal protein L9
MSATSETTYRSPLNKLVRFFRKSRDGWKRKYQEAKALAKRLTNGMQALKRSRDRWKSLAKQRREELRQLRRELEAQKMACP